MQQGLWVFFPQLTGKLPTHWHGKWARSSHLAVGTWANKRRDVLYKWLKSDTFAHVCHSAGVKTAEAKHTMVGIEIKKMTKPTKKKQKKNKGKEPKQTSQQVSRLDSSLSVKPLFVLIYLFIFILKFPLLLSEVQ